MKTPIHVYIAGASAELELAESCMKKIRDAGHLITHDWTKVVRAAIAAGAGANSGMSREEEKRHAEDDLYGVESADLFWLLVPSNTSVGAWIELGSAITGMVGVVIASGPKVRSIFAALVDHHFEDHDKALQFILELAK